jgi:type VI protein secretion system component VasF
VDLAFGGRYAVGAGGQVALEDYARALTRAERAEVFPAPDGGVGGLHLCAPAEPLRAAVVEDIEAFARDMAERAGDGLGWS